MVKKNGGAFGARLHNHRFMVLSIEPFSQPPPPPVLGGSIDPPPPPPLKTYHPLGQVWGLSSHCQAVTPDSQVSRVCQGWER